MALVAALPMKASAKCAAEQDPISKTVAVKGLQSVGVKDPASKQPWVSTAELRVEGEKFEIGLPVMMHGVQQYGFRAGSEVALALGDGSTMALPLVQDATPASSFGGVVFTSWTLWIQVSRDQAKSMAESGIVLWRLEGEGSKLEGEFTGRGSKSAKKLIACGLEKSSQ